MEQSGQTDMIHIAMSNAMSQHLEILEVVTDSCHNFFERLHSIDRTLLLNLFERGTESSFRYFFQNSIERLENHRFTTLQELGVYKTDNKYGYIDLLAINSDLDYMIMIETKSFWSNLNEPQYEWTADKTHNYFNSLILRQPASYFNPNDLLFNLIGSVYACVICFARVETEDLNLLHPDWSSFDQNEPDQFYAFSKFEFGHVNFGLAVYGYLIKLL